MSLKFATPYLESLPKLPEQYPYPTESLEEWMGIPFWLNPSDPRLMDLHLGGSAPTPPLENLEGMIHYWEEHPEWMDFLDPSSPTYHDKRLECALYQNFWEELIQDNQKVLDIGGGVGRIGHLFLKKNAVVHTVDPDLRSLWRNLGHAIGLSGAIDLHWGTAETLPNIDCYAPNTFDVIVACEVLNYVEDPELSVKHFWDLLKPGGVLLLSVEARWGWAMSKDVAEGTLDAFLHTGIVHVPNDRWIRTYTQEDIYTLLRHFTILKMQPSHYSFSGPFEWIVAPSSATELLEIEEKLRSHPISNPLNRAWMVVAQKS